MIITCQLPVVMGSDLPFWPSKGISFRNVSNWTSFRVFLYIFSNTGKTQLSLHSCILIQPCTRLVVIKLSPKSVIPITVLASVQYSLVEISDQTQTNVWNEPLQPHWFDTTRMTGTAGPPPLHFAFFTTASGRSNLSLFAFFGQNILSDWAASFWTMSWIPLMQLNPDTDV